MFGLFYRVWCLIVVCVDVEISCDKRRMRFVRFWLCWRTCLILYCWGFRIVQDDFKRLQNLCTFCAIKCFQQNNNNKVTDINIRFFFFLFMHLSSPSAQFKFCDLLKTTIMFFILFYFWWILNLFVVLKIHWNFYKRKASGALAQISHKSF